MELILEITLRTSAVCIGLIKFVECRIKKHLHNPFTVSDLFLRIKGYTSKCA